MQISGYVINYTRNKRHESTKITFAWTRGVFSKFRRIGTLLHSDGAQYTLILLARAVYAKSRIRHLHSSLKRAQCVNDKNHLLKQNKFLT